MYLYLYYTQFCRKIQLFLNFLSAPLQQNIILPLQFKVKKKVKDVKVQSEVNFPSSFFDCDMRDKSVPEDQRKESKKMPITDCIAEWRLITNG